MDLLRKLSQLALTGHIRARSIYNIYPYKNSLCHYLSLSKEFSEWLIRKEARDRFYFLFVLLQCAQVIIWDKSYDDYYQLHWKGLSLSVYPCNDNSFLQSKVRRTWALYPIYHWLHYFIIFEWNLSVYLRFFVGGDVDDDGHVFCIQVKCFELNWIELWWLLPATLKGA